jgi:hypothetical protein
VKIRLLETIYKDQIAMKVTIFYNMMEERKWTLSHCQAKHQDKHIFYFERPNGYMYKSKGRRKELWLILHERITRICWLTERSHSSMTLRSPTFVHFFSSCSCIFSLLFQEWDPRDIYQKFQPCACVGK